MRYVLRVSNYSSIRRYVTQSCIEHEFIMMLLKIFNIQALERLGSSAN